MNNNLLKSKNEMLSRADEAVKMAAQEFTENLKVRVKKLEGEIHSGNKKEAVKVAYDLESEAATFGWPQVTRICKWFRKVLSGEYEQQPEAEDILNTLNILKLMVSDPDNQDQKRDEELFQSVLPSLQKTVSDI